MKTLTTALFATLWVVGLPWVVFWAAGVLLGSAPEFSVASVGAFWLVVVLVMVARYVARAVEVA